MINKINSHQSKKPNQLTKNKYNNITNEVKQKNMNLNNMVNTQLEIKFKSNYLQLHDTFNLNYFSSISTSEMELYMKFIVNIQKELD